MNLGADYSSGEGRATGPLTVLGLETSCDETAASVVRLTPRGEATEEEAEQRNEADNLIYAADKLVKQDLKDKVKPEQAEKVNKLTQELRDAIGSNNAEAVKAKIQELKSILAEISTAAYQGAGAATSTASQAGPEPGGFAGGQAGSAAGPNPSP